MPIAGTALIFGAAGGIGTEIALAFAENGANALFLADLNLQGAQATNEKCVKLRHDAGQLPIKVHVSKVDVTDQADVQRVVDAAYVELNRIDHFVNASGFGNPGQSPICDTSFEDYKAMDAVHNHGTFLSLKAVLGKMRQQDLAPTPVTSRRLEDVSHPRYMSRGSVVVVASLASIGAFLGVGPYVAAKHAVIGIVRNAALENASSGIRINAVSSSYVSGDRMDSFLEQAPEVKQDLLSDLPLGRLAHPTEIADVVTFLCSAAASYVNGHNMIVDGGASVSLAHGKF